MLAPFFSFVRWRVLPGFGMCLKILSMSLVLLSSLFGQERPGKVGTFDYVGDGNPRQTLDLYLPAQKGEELLPVIFWIHGGAWLQGSKDRPGQALRAAQSGAFAVVSINYRLTQEAIWPAQIHDCKAALRWVKGNAKKHGIDPGRIMVWGASAGGHLVSMLGVTQDDKVLDGTLGKYPDQSTKVKAVINFFGPADLLVMNSQGSRMDHNAPGSPEGKLLGGTVSELEKAARSASPLYHVTRDDAPILTVHGTNDPLVPYAQGLAFDRKLDALNVSSILLTVEGAGHGRGFGESVDRAVVAFLKEHGFGEKSDLKDAVVK